MTITHHTTTPGQGSTAEPFMVDRKDLQHALGWVSRAIPTRSSTPILQGLRMSSDGHQMTLAATDYEQSASASLRLSGGPAVDVIMPGRLCADLVKSLPGADVLITVHPNTVQLAAGRAKFTIPRYPTGEYPTLPATPPAIGTVDGAAFAAAVREVTTAAAKDDALPILTGVLVTVDSAAGTVAFAATDRYRLAERVITFAAAPGDATSAAFLIPAKALDGYARAVGTNSTVKLHADATTDTVLFGVTVDGRTATTRLLAGEFPSYQRLFDSVTATATASVDRELFLDAVKRVALVTERSSPITVQLAGEELTITVNAAGASAAAAQEVVDDITYSGSDTFTIGFNAGYLADALEALPGERVDLTLNNPNKPILLVPRSSDGTSPASLRHLLMPVRLSATAG